MENVKFKSVGSDGGGEGDRLDLQEILAAFEKGDLRLNLHAGERKILEIRGREKNVDVEVLDPEGLRELIRALRG
jgi:hypothetical protein